LIVFSAAVALGCFWASRKFRQMNREEMAKVSNQVGYGMWLIAVFGALENTVLIFTFKEDTWVLGPQIVMLAASAKYLLTSLGILFILIFLVSWLSWLRTPRKAEPG
jgi:Na+/H+-dicarboxylate symporter